MSTTTAGTIVSSTSASTSTSVTIDDTTVPMTTDNDGGSHSTTTSTVAVTNPSTTVKSEVTTTPTNEPTTSSTINEFDSSTTTPASSESTIVTSAPTTNTDNTVITNEPTTISVISTTTVKSVKTDPTVEFTTDSTTYALVSSSTVTSSLSKGEISTVQVTTSSIPSSAESTKATSGTTDLNIGETTDTGLVLAEEYMNVLSDFVETGEFLIEIQSQGSNLAQVSSIEFVGNLTIISEDFSSSGRAEVEAACKLVGITVEQFGATEQNAFVKLIAQDVSVEESQVVIISISEITSTRKLLSFRALNEAGILVEFGIVVPEESPTTTSTTIVTEEPTENIQLAHTIPGEMIAIIVIFVLLVLTGAVVAAVIMHRKYAKKEKVDQGEATYDIEAPIKKTSLRNSYLSAEASSASPKGLQLKPLTSFTYSPLHKDAAFAKLVSNQPKTTNDDEEIVVRSFSSIHSP